MHPNEALVRDYIDAGKQGDYDAIRAIMHEDVVMHFFGRNPVAGTHRGREETWASTTEEWEPRQLQFEILEVNDIVVNDERAVLIMDVRISGPEKSVDLHRVDVYRIEDGRIVELWVYDHDQYALDELFD